MTVRWRRALPGAALALCLGACQSGGGGGLFASRGSPAGKPIALESIEGLPPAARTALADELASAATSRQVELVGSSAEARYRVRGYLSSEAGVGGGTQLAFVWDVFDVDKRRAKRVTGASPIRAASLEGLDKDALRRLAAESMDEIATFLSASAPAAEIGETPGAS